VGDCFARRRIVVKFSMRPLYYDPLARRSWYLRGTTYRRAHISWEYKLSTPHDATVSKNLFTSQQGVFPSLWKRRVLSGSR